MLDEPWWARGVDVTRPSSARVYDVHLGGSHNFEVDRELAERAARMMPSLPSVLRANRSFLRRVVAHLAGAGITQFLDLGSGIPTVGNVHEIAQRVDPRSRVAYVDSDLVAVAHSRAILRDAPRATAVRADFRDAAAVLSHPGVTGLLDFDEPVAVLFFAVLHFVPDDDDPAGIVAAYADALAPGGHLALSHACSDDAPSSTRQAAEMYSERIGGFYPRPLRRIAEMFAGLPMLPPGLVDLTDWHPDTDAPDTGTPDTGAPGAPGERPRTGPGGVAVK
ncbi:SAM-dependent methyltransferase [Saccharopolyspora sp. CA-218241]|uniref:SAM-dependent methyltransferase n=1 Tax=Saccharopolyspora sp. CA-218241 TaxID=3240027 RepID=UPI003D9528EB